MTHCAARRLGAFLLIVVCLAGCAGSPAFREGRDLAADGNLEAALLKLRKATDDEPGNAEYRTAYLRTRELLIGRWVEQANVAWREGRLADTEKIYRRILEEDAVNARARDGLEEIARANRHLLLLKEAEGAMKKQEPGSAMLYLRHILAENPEHVAALELKRKIDEKSATGTPQPRLAAGLRKPISIEFKDSPLRQIFEVLSRTSGLNFVFDKDVKGEQRATIFLRNTSVQDALNLLMLTNQLEQRVLDGNSILIFPNSAAKLKDYQPLSVKSFFLSNVDAKSMGNTLKTMLKTKDMVIDEKQNLIVMRDTVDAIRMAEKLIAMQDQAEPEIMLDVAILEVSRTHLMNLGVQWPGQVAFAPLENADGNVTLRDLRRLGTGTVGVTLPPMTIQANKQDGNVNLLANPRIRARNRETAKIMIGDRIPNITSTATATGFVSENIQYVDVGLKLEVQPTVNADSEVAIKIALEVSSVVNQIQTKSGSLAYQIGTRNASTLLKLKDGENQILAGLIRNEETSTGNRVPGLGEIPVLGRLFGSQRDDANKTEIILSITPRLIRNVRRPDFGLLEFDSGTESSLKSRPDGMGVNDSSSGNAGSVRVPIQSGADKAFTAPSPAAPLSSSGTPENATGAATALALKGPAQVKAGSTFDVQLTIEPGQPISSIPVAITFDPKTLEVLSVTEGDFLKQGGGASSFSNRIDRNSGQVFATVTRSGKDGASNPGNILNLSLRSLAPATESRLTVSAIAPIGLEGRAANATPPLPLLISVTP